MARLWVIGDSTLSSFNDKYFYPRYGYGTKMQKYLTSDVEVVNIALSGRSSKSYMEEPEYSKLLEGMSEGDFLIIGFGHNDEKTEAGRFTSATGTYKDAGTFANSLYENYIKPAEEAGCKTILCTSIVRRSATGNWNDAELHIIGNTGGFIGGDYPQMIRDMGAQLNIPVVDMTSMTQMLYDKMTPENTKYLHAWCSSHQLSVDNTHTNIWGATVNAYMCMKAVKELNISGLSEYIVVDDEVLDETWEIPSKEKYLVTNPEYVPIVFDANLKDSELWKDAGQWKGTVFGDVGSAPNKDNFVLEPISDSSLRIAVKNNSGKIAASSDGIAMYYAKVPANKNFVLTATATINDYFLNNQVSFGLMARDDMYIDKAAADLLGDYVAAAPLLITRGADAVNCFARKSGLLVYGGQCSKTYEIGDVVNLRIESNDDGYACTYGDEQTITGGFDFKLTTIDAENVYVGMFVSRNADVTFSNIKLEIK
ncbi:MAG: carbohydrate esterase family 12 protein [Lachnospira sp.]|nr:carbohydrate esterase family 12 protein [Lachnospira sp.]